MIQRRSVLQAIAAGALSAALPAFAQQQSRVWRIGYLGLGGSAASPARFAAFHEGMAALGWMQGRDYVIVDRYAKGETQDGPRVAAELVAAKPDLLMTPGDVGTRLLIQKTKTMPILFVISQDPVGNGFAASLQRPGGNATGLTNLSRDLAAKRLQLLKEAFPRIANVALLFDPSDAGSVSVVKETEASAAQLGVRIAVIEMRQAEDVEAAFKRGAALGAQAYIQTSGFFANLGRKATVAAVARARVPAMYVASDSVDLGGLMFYGPAGTDKESFRRAAAYADKIFKGARPGDLPIEQPTKFELVINLKTAKAMAFTIPQSILLRADRVVQ